jgi:hypothetical protein
LHPPYLEPFCEIKSKTCHLKEPFLNLPFIRYELYYLNDFQRK